MASRHACGGIRTVAHRSGTPLWEPLLAALGEELTSWFMWMHEETLADGARVQAYKHQATRRYLYLGVEDDGYARAPCGCLAPLRLDFVIEQTLSTWWFLDGGSEHVRDLISAAVHAAQDRGHARELGW